jgi:S1-C subfamily serine protease
VLGLTASIVLLTVALASGSRAASFDCSHASSKDEILICSDSDLSELDEELGRTYEALRAELTGQQWKPLQTNQRHWIERRNVGCQLDRDTMITSQNKGPFVECLSTATTERLLFLYGLLQLARGGGAAGAETLPPADAEPIPESGARRSISGSGIVVSNAGLVVTNAHVVKECTAIRVANQSSGASAASLLAIDEIADLALLRTELKLTEAATIRDRPVRVGEEIVVLGYPLRGILGTGIIVSEGIVSAARGLLDDSSQMQISAPVQPGNSGGPVLDTSGHIAGIVVAKLDALMMAQTTGDIPQNVNFAIKSSAVRQFLDSHGVRYRAGSGGVRQGVPGITTSASPKVVMIACE